MREDKAFLIIYILVFFFGLGFFFGGLQIISFYLYTSLHRPLLDKYHSISRILQDLKITVHV